MKDNGFDVLWTPPYTPDLQPIETFWAIGKNRVAENYFSDRSMKTCVEQLREGWYGNETLPHKSIERTVSKADCLGIFNKTIRIANQRFVALCPDLSGTLGSLVYANNRPGSSAAFPIDLVVADYAAIVDIEEESNDSAEVDD